MWECRRVQSSNRWRVMVHDMLRYCPAVSAMLWKCRLKERRLMQYFRMHHCLLVESGPVLLDSLLDTILLNFFIQPLVLLFHSLAVGSLAVEYF